MTDSSPVFNINSGQSSVSQFPSKLRVVYKQQHDMLNNTRTPPRVTLQAPWEGTKHCVESTDIPADNLFLQESSHFPARIPARPGMMIAVT